jgi:hypothetical protein
LISVTTGNLARIRVFSIPTGTRNGEEILRERDEKKKESETEDISAVGVFYSFLFLLFAFLRRFLGLLAALCLQTVPVFSQQFPESKGIDKRCL